MPDISLDYNEIEKVASDMTTAESQIVPQLQSLKTSVDGLLDNGLYMKLSSPKMKQAYADLTTSLQQAMNSIPEFAKQFQNIKTQVEQMDQTIANSTSK